MSTMAWSRANRIAAELYRVQKNSTNKPAGVVVHIGLLYGLSAYPSGRAV